VSPDKSLDEIVYRSKFRRWEERAAVRSKPRRMLDPDQDSSLLYFPPEMVPVVSHDLVLRLGDDAIRRMLVQRLHVYLDFTAELEQRAVNPVCAEISRRKSGFDLPEGMIEDAFKIYTDEAWHAQFSDDMQRQIVDETSVPPVLPDAPAFIKRLAAAERAAPLDSRGLVPFFFTIVSETLISAILSDIPKDRRVVRAVREIVGDHAVDEGVHRAYFTKLLELAWRQLGKRQRRVVAQQLPGFVRGFLDPDFPALAGVLKDAGLDDEEVGQVLNDCYTPKEVAARVRADARPTLRELARVGVFDDPAAAAAFEDADLVGAGDVTMMR